MIRRTARCSCGVTADLANVPAGWSPSSAAGDLCPECAVTR